MHADVKKLRAMLSNGNVDQAVQLLQNNNDITHLDLSQLYLAPDVINTFVDRLPAVLPKITHVDLRGAIQKTTEEEKLNKTLDGIDQRPTREDDYNNLRNLLGAKSRNRVDILTAIEERYKDRPDKAAAIFQDLKQSGYDTYLCVASGAEYYASSHVWSHLDNRLPYLEHYKDDNRIGYAEESIFSTSEIFARLLSNGNIPIADVVDFFIQQRVNHLDFGEGIYCGQPRFAEFVQHLPDGLAKQSLDIAVDEYPLTQHPEHAVTMRTFLRKLPNIETVWGGCDVNILPELLDKPLKRMETYSCDEAGLARIAQSNLPQTLTTLALDDTLTPESIAAHLPSFKNLRHFEIENASEFNAAMLDAVAQLPKLESLAWDGRYTVPEHEMNRLKTMKNLSDISFVGMGEWVEGFNARRDLDLRYCEDVADTKNIASMEDSIHKNSILRHGRKALATSIRHGENTDAAVGNLINVYTEILGDNSAQASSLAQKDVKNITRGVKEGQEIRAADALSQMGHWVAKTAPKENNQNTTEVPDYRFL